MPAVIENRVVRSTMQNMIIPEVDVGSFIRAACARFTERTAVIDDTTGKRYTYRDLQELSTRVAAGLWMCGFRPGQMAGLHCETNPEMFFAFYGVVFAGGSVVFAKPESTERELRYHFGDTCPSVVFCDEANAIKIRAACQAIPSVKTLVVFGDCEGFLPMASLLRASLDGFEPPVVSNLDATAAVLFSTGTTGHPKGVLISHRNIVAQSLISGEHLGYLEKTDTMLGYLPFTHVCGAWLYGTVFSVGATLVLVTKMEMNTMMSAIEKYKISMMFHFPSFTINMLRSGLLERSDISSVQKIIIGGACLPSTVGEEILTDTIFGHLDIFGTGYGMTESFGGVTGTPTIHKEYDSVGIPIPMTHIKVVDVHTREKLGAGERGEICIKGPTCSPGYFNEPKNAAPLYDSEGFIQTGDIGYYTEEGRFYVVDRLKDMIRCMDRQVPPAELEDILLKHPNVKEAAVFGVPHPEYGEAARAVVVLRDDVLDEELTEGELRKLIQDECAAHKHLYGGVEFVSSIPRSANGKYLRRALRDLFTGKSLP